MPRCSSEYLGGLEWEPEAELTFPAGLPGFETERRFVAVKKRDLEPCVFLQSATNPGVCFLTVPVRLVDRDYELAMDPDDLGLLGLPEDGRPEAGGHVLCLAIVSARGDSPPSANLLAPVVVNVTNRLAVQAIRTDERYSLREPLGACEAGACS